MSLKFAVASLLIAAAPVAVSGADQPKRVLLLGQKRDHPPGTHEYMAGLKVLAKDLKGG